MKKRNYFISIHRTITIDSLSKKKSLDSPWASTLVLTFLLFTSGLFTAQSQTIWDAGSFTFTKTAAGQEDCITSQTCLTRVTVLYNSVCQTVSGNQGCFYTGPCNTEWAQGVIADWNTLSYDNFYIANGCRPASGLPKDYVVHLITENIYLQVTFTQWQPGGLNFSYTRTTGPSPTGITLNLKIFIEGLYTANRQMTSVLFNSNMNTDPTACDSIIIELHSVDTPDDVIASANALLHTDGSSVTIFPSSLLNNSYYLVIRHYNTIETWSKNPVAFNLPAISFDFTSP